jgi:hypothetical protein
MGHPYSMVIHQMDHGVYILIPSNSGVIVGEAMKVYAPSCRASFLAWWTRVVPELWRLRKGVISWCDVVVAMIDVAYVGTRGIRGVYGFLW